MLKHVLMFRLKEEALGNKKDYNLLKLKEALEALPAKIEEIQAWEVGINTVASPADLFLHSVFADGAALERYRAHPEHQKVVELIRQVCEERWVVDYEATASGTSSA